MSTPRRTPAQEQETRCGQGAAGRGRAALRRACTQAPHVPASRTQALHVLASLNQALHVSASRTESLHVPAPRTQALHVSASLNQALHVPASLNQALHVPASRTQALFASAPRPLAAALLAVLLALFSPAAPLFAQGEGGDAAAGKALFEGNCVICHGTGGKGDGPAAAGFNPKPADFTDRSRMSRSPETRRFKTVLEGGASVGLSPLMPPFREVLSEQQVRDVLAYVKDAFVRFDVK
jgi:mono/diheme cytochrome c family protein